MAERKTCAPGEARGDTGSASVRAQGASEPVKELKPSLSKRVFATMLAMSLATIVVLALALTIFMQQRLMSSTSAALANEARIVAASLNSSPSYFSMLKRLRLDNTRVTLVEADGDVLYDSDIDASVMEDHGNRPEIEDTIVVLALALTIFMQQRLMSSTSAALANEARIVAASLNSSPSYFSMLTRLRLDNTRVTLVEADGDVLYDSDIDASVMEDHGNRPEIEDALRTGRAPAAGRPTARAPRSVRSCCTRPFALPTGAWCALPRARRGTWPSSGRLRARSCSCRSRAWWSRSWWPVANRAASSSRCSRSTWTTPAAVPRTPMPKWSQCWSASRASARNSSARCACSRTTTACAASSRRTSRTMLERIESQRQELKRQVRVLADNDRMRREFTANITHELKTPLTTVSGYAELIANGLVTDESDLRDFGRRIYSEAGRLTSLVNDILTLSNLDEAERSEGESAAANLGAREPLDVPRTLEGIAHATSVAASTARPAG